MSRLLSHVLTFSRAFVGQCTQNMSPCQTLLPKGPMDACVSAPVSKGWLYNIIRESHKTFVPKEYVRVKRLSFYAKVKTRKGRLQIMRRILKGRFVLTH